MLYLLVKAALSGLIVSAASEAGRRSPAFGALIIALPLSSILAMVWLWRDTRDPERVAALAAGAFWYVLPSLPMFLLIPALLRRGLGFWPALGAGCLLTIVLYGLMTAIGSKFGLKIG